MKMAWPETFPGPPDRAGQPVEAQDAAPRQPRTAVTGDMVQELSRDKFTPVRRE